MASLFIWWFALLVAGEVGRPVATRIFHRFPDRGLGLAKPLGLLAVGYVWWLTASLGVGSRGADVAAGVAALALALAGRRSTSPLPSLGERFRAEAIFLGALLAFAAIRALRPEILGAEKLMDLAFLSTLAGTDVIPPEDPWLAGETINYYYFGYLLFANLTRWTATAPEIGYHLALATIGALLFCGALSIGRTLSRTFGWVAGIAAAWAGNFDGAIQLFGEGRLVTFDYWRASRIVPNTINEFPFFSFIHGDLHPHVMAIVPLVLLLGVAVAFSAESGNLFASSGDRLAAGAAGLASGTIALTSPWSLATVIAVVGATVLLRARKQSSIPRSIGIASVAAASVVGIGLLAAVPFSLHFDAPFRGFGWVRERTGLGPFALGFGAWLLPVAAVAAGEIARRLGARPEWRDLAFALAVLGALGAGLVSAPLVLGGAVLGFALVTLLGRHEPLETSVGLPLLAAGAALLVACEILYVRDPYGDALHRMNTVFKFWFDAWICVAIALPAFLASAVERLPRPMAAIVLAALLVSVLAYPVGAIASRLPSSVSELSLDGYRDFERRTPDDAGAIRKLRELPRGVVLEATGPPYTEYARVSAHTGFPTVLGWANHENVWRGHVPTIGERTLHVKTLYESVDVEETVDLLRRYRVRWVFVGSLERRDFQQPGLDKFRTSSSFAPTIQVGKTTVYEMIDREAGQSES